uniref:Olfactory receptor, family 70, subfamily B, member 1 n=1 Tax=Neolamprologus brichardi TaxID=32507 RepID=A0A3Q4HVB3_NEOBR
MENYTYNSYILQLEGLNTSKDSLYPAFLFLFFSYLFIMIINVGITILIFMNKNLHQPMYLLFCNLPLNDILVNSIVLPRLLIDLMRPPSERLISYYQCVVQAYIASLIGTTSHTVLMIMAYDRYVAICNPFHYVSIMTNKMMIKLTVCAWGVAFVLVGILLGLTTRLNRCRTLITNPYCDNASLFKLSCESVVINNIYGITFTVAVYVGSIGAIVLSYTSIAVVCLTSKNKSLNSKALKTCISIYILEHYHPAVSQCHLLAGFVRRSVTSVAAGDLTDTLASTFAKTHLLEIVLSAKLSWRWKNNQRFHR